MITAEGTVYSMDVPWDIQEWLLEATGDMMLKEVIYLIEKYWVDIRRLMTDRHAEGYVRFGDEMYNFTPSKRLQNVLEEIADAATYLTSGPTLDKDCGCEGECVHRPEPVV